MSSAPFCRPDHARPIPAQRRDHHTVHRVIGSMIADAYEVPPPNPEIDRLCRLLDGHPGLR